jgi:hypothetical protein
MEVTMNASKIFGVLLLVGIFAAAMSNKSSPPSDPAQAATQAETKAKAEVDSDLLNAANTVQRSHLACYNKGDFDRFNTLWTTADRETWNRFAAQMVMQSRCVVLTEGQTITWEQGDGWNNRQCVRLPGEFYCAWTRISFKSM